MRAVAELETHKEAIPAALEGTLALVEKGPIQWVMEVVEASAAAVVRHRLGVKEVVGAALEVEAGCQMVREVLEEGDSYLDMGQEWVALGWEEPSSITMVKFWSPIRRSHRTWPVGVSARPLAKGWAEASST